MFSKAAKVRRVNVSFSRKENKMPASLIFAQLFLTAICVSYVFKISTTMMSILVEEILYPSAINAIMLMMNLVFLLTTVYALLGISSRRAESWKKVVTSCFTFTLSAVMSALFNGTESYQHVLDFNPVITFIILTLVVLMMLFSDSIKRFYTPPLVRVRPTSEWINFLLFGRLYNVEYQIRFEDSMQERGEAPDEDF